MILNRFCSQNELEHTLSKEELDSISHVLQTMLPNTKMRSIYQDRKILGQIHYAINIGKYVKKQFRKQLYDGSKEEIPDTWERYFEECGVKKDLSKIPWKKREEIIDQHIKFEWGNNEPTKRFVNFFEYPDYMIPDDHKPYKMTDVIFGKKAKFEPLKVLLDYQAVIVSRVLKEMKNINAFCLMQMPTGTGKTRTAMEVVARLFNSNPDIQIIWFANKSELLGQAYESFVHIWNHLGTFPVTAIVAWGNKPIPKIPQKKVMIFATYQKMRNFLKTDNSLKPHYIIVDEAHQVLAKTYDKQVHSLARKNSARVLGLTATPGRGINEEQNKLLAEWFHTKIIQIQLYDEDKKYYENNIVKYLEDEEILANAKCKTLRTNVKYDLTKEEWEKLTKLVQGDRPELTTKVLQKLANDNARNILIIDELRKLAEKGKKILYFGTSKSQSILVFIVLQQLGIKTIHVDESTDPIFRRQIIKKFIDTEQIQIICNYDIFSTGFDVPKLDVVFVGRPVNSPVLFNQMVGRGTRGRAMNGKKFFLLVQVVDKITSESTEFDPYEQYGYWDKNWSRAKQFD